MASTSAANVTFVGQSKSSTGKVNFGGFSSGSYGTSSSNQREREVPTGFADEVMYSLFSRRSNDNNGLKLGIYIINGPYLYQHKLINHREETYGTTTNGGAAETKR